MASASTNHLPIDPDDEQTEVVVVLDLGNPPVGRASQMVDQLAALISDEVTVRGAYVVGGYRARAVLIAARGAEHA